MKVDDADPEITCLAVVTGYQEVFANKLETTS